jgi:hypothetical protein
MRTFTSAASRIYLLALFVISACFVFSIKFKCNQFGTTPCADANQIHIRLYRRFSRLLQSVPNHRNPMFLYHKGELSCYVRTH